jgi:hypothetical protein
VAQKAQALDHKVVDEAERVDQDEKGGDQDLVSVDVVLADLEAQTAVPSEVELDPGVMVLEVDPRDLNDRSKSDVHIKPVHDPCFRALA